MGKKTPCKTQGQGRSAEEKSGKDPAGALIEQLSHGPMARVAALCNGWMPEGAGAWYTGMKAGWPTLKTITN